jgi:hypothetical protein
VNRWLKHGWVGVGLNGQADTRPAAKVGPGPARLETPSPYQSHHSPIAVVTAVTGTPSAA